MTDTSKTALLLADRAQCKAETIVLGLVLVAIQHREWKDPDRLTRHLVPVLIGVKMMTAKVRLGLRTSK